jgi:hypothetical protein
MKMDFVFRQNGISRCVDQIVRGRTNMTTKLFLCALACLFVVDLEGCTPSEPAGARDRDSVEAPWDTPQSGPHANASR